MADSHQNPPASTEAPGWSTMTVELYKQLLLEMPQRHSVASLLQHVTQRISAAPGVALVRIWILRPPGQCSACLEKRDCRPDKGCLHLVSSAGRSVDGSTTWERIDGRFSRFCMGLRKVGSIAARAEPMEISPVDPDAEWVADPEWMRREGIVAFGGQPVTSRGETLGVLALFSRAPFEENTLTWLRMVADHLGAALVNARSFEEIESLRRRVELENVYLRKEVDAEHRGQGVVGESSVMKTILRKVSQVAPTDANILVTGESGTGKEVIAREIHARSKRHAQPMIKVNCAAIPRELFESEFFGHAKGSFTGAARERFGLFQAADRGTLFLDEVSEIPLELQGKLLRVLQEREYRRVGEEVERKVDVRIIAASNRDLPAAVAAGRFREDLYYRLQVFPFEIPPLRERTEDIPLLARHFLAQLSQRMDRPGLQLTEEDLLSLQGYDWPGNCRELQNVIERAVITAQGTRPTVEIPGTGRLRPREVPAVPAPHGARDVGKILTDQELRDLERRNTLAALEKCHWRIYGARSASKLLGVKPTTLLSRLKKMGIKPRQRGAAADDEA